MVQAIELELERSLLGAHASASPGLFSLSDFFDNVAGGTALAACYEYLALQDMANEAMATAESFADAELTSFNNSSTCDPLVLAREYGSRPGVICIDAFIADSLVMGGMEWFVGNNRDFSNDNGVQTSKMQLFYEPASGKIVIEVGDSCWLDFYRIGLNIQFGIPLRNACSRGLAEATVGPPAADGSRQITARAWNGKYGRLGPAIQADFAVSGDGQTISQFTRSKVPSFHVKRSVAGGGFVSVARLPATWGWFPYMLMRTAVLKSIDVHGTLPGCNPQ